VLLICNRRDNGDDLVGVHAFPLAYPGLPAPAEGYLARNEPSWPGIHYQLDMVKRHGTSSMRFVSSWSRSDP
jgi:hypothetical protein